MADLNAHEAGNGGQSQGKPTACGVLLYSETIRTKPHVRITKHIKRSRYGFTEGKTANFVREVFTSNFWMSGLAMLKYTPRSFRVKQVGGMAFFTESKHDEFRDRVLRITPANPRQWGTMNVSQMLHHLNLACSGSLGFYDVPDESYLVSRTVFRWILVDWYPEQPVGLRLPKGFKIPHGATFDFGLKKEQLLKILDAAWHAISPADWQPHPMFGRMTVKEWGKLLQIHIDYHLRQFAA